MALVVKNPPANAGDVRDTVRSLGQEDSLEEGMATHSSILSWRISWTEGPGVLQSIRLKRVEHDWRDLACTHKLCGPSHCILRYRGPSVSEGDWFQDPSWMPESEDAQAPYYKIAWCSNKTYAYRQKEPCGLQSVGLQRSRTRLSDLNNKNNHNPPVHVKSTILNTM